MSTEISYKDLKKEMLSDKSLGLLLEFVSIWRANTGKLIDLSADDVVAQVLRNAKRSNDRRSRSIYLHLRAEFTNKLESSLTQCDAMLAVQLMSHISNGRTCQLQGIELVG